MQTQESCGTFEKKEDGNQGPLQKPTCPLPWKPGSPAAPSQRPGEQLLSPHPTPTPHSGQQWAPSLRHLECPTGGMIPESLCVPVHVFFSLQITGERWKEAGRYYQAHGAMATAKLFGKSEANDTGLIFVCVY